MTASSLLVWAALWTAVDAPDRAQESAQRPRLVVLIVIDQFPAWVIPRVERHFVPAGFRRLMNDGAISTRQCTVHRIRTTHTCRFFSRDWGFGPASMMSKSA